MRSTMQDHQLTVYSLFKHGAAVYRNSRLAAFDGQRVRRTTYEETASRVARLASGLQRLGIRPGDRVGSFCWNTLEHLEAYFAVPGMGAVLHTLNSRLFPDQLSYIVNHAEDRAIIVDASLVPVLAKVAAKFRTVEHYIVIGPSTEELPEECVDYGEMLAAGPAHFEWPALDERAAAAMCYTSGTTGNPKGVVYSHRSIYLHSMAVNSANCLGLSQHDRLLVGPSMFHANSWGLPHSAWMAGSDMVFPNRFLQPEPLCRLIAEERCTVAGGVPAIWMEVLRYADSHAVDLSSLRLVVCGGSAVPRNLIENFQQRHGLRILQLWGMTETSPVAAIAHPPKGCPNSEELDYRAKSGRTVAGVELRVVDSDNLVVPADGESIGEIQARGPWITGSYYGEDAADKFHDGWLRTDDMGCIDSFGYIQIKDRTKDVIKSGGNGSLPSNWKMRSWRIPTCWRRR